MSKISGNTLHENASIDIVKLIMAYLVIAIHTEPFGFSFWLDKGFGIVTRLCVPFFFVASSYFFFTKNNNPVKYMKRIFVLYFIWSVIYLPFDIIELKEMSIMEVFVKYLWTGNGHALWYLCGSMVGFMIVYVLSRLMSPKKVFIITAILLLIGCLKSTYAPIIEDIFTIEIEDVLGSRNGLFYAATYYALGLLIAKEKDSCKKLKMSNVIGLVVSLIMLCIESLVLVWIFKTQDTILWISVLPLTYNFFMLVKNIELALDDRYSYFIRKMSTLIYLSHCYFMYLLIDFKYFTLFVLVLICATLLSVVVIMASRHNYFRWMRNLS